MKRRGLAAIAFLATGLYGQTPPPIISSISPSSVIAGSPAFTLTVTGTGFQRLAVGAGYLSTSQVRWNGVALATGYLSTTERVATIDASLVASAGTATVDVVNPGPVVSNSVVFTIVAPLAITTTSPLPSGLAASPYLQSLTATGGTGSRTWLVVSGTPPPGLTLSPGSGTMTGTPTTAGAYRFTVRVTDSQGFFAERTFNLSIAQSGSTQGPDGVVGVAYSATLVATSGTGPWTWLITSGQLPPGLTLNSITGVISGIPTTAGTSTFVAQWTDSQGLVFPNTFAIRILAGPLTITTTSLNAMVVGVPFSQTLAASLGTPPYSNWRVVEGLLPAGLTINANTGVVSGIPTAAGSGFAQVSVDDSARSSASQVLNWAVNPAVLTIAPNSPLPNATAGTSYSQTFTVTGGIAPYTWSVPSGTLPSGLALNAAGVLSGTPTQDGRLDFTVRVADASGSFTTKPFSLTVTVPEPSTLSVTGLTDTATPAQQPTFDVQLSSTYPLIITGTVTLTFAPNAVNAADDPTIQFSGGGRTLNFSIPAGQLNATWGGSSHAIGTGTVAGQINLTLENLAAGGQSITPPPARVVTIARAAPSISSVQVVRVTGGFNILVRGYSTPRQVTQAVFAFTPASGANLQTTQVTVPVDSAFTTWYTGTSSAQFGSVFLYTQPFTVQGNVSDITSVSVTISNATGTSAAVSANF